MSFYNIPVFEANNDTTIMFCDSNFCLELARYYYRGKCVSVDTEEFVEFLLEKRALTSWFVFEFALKELSFDYSNNAINNAMYKRLNAAVNSILQMTDSEMRCHSGIKTEWSRDRDQTCNASSIFESRFPNVVAGEMRGLEIERLFYATYLFRIKLQELYLDYNIDPVKKVEVFFDYCVDRIGMLPGAELQLAQMLFVGDSDAERTAKKLLKVDSAPSIKLFNNSVEDIFLMRICQKFSLETQILCPCSVSFLTSDKALSDLLMASSLVASSNFAADITTIDIGIRPRFLDRWTQLYETKILPTMYKRYITSFLKKNLDFNIIKQEIIALEKAVL